MEKKFVPVMITPFNLKAARVIVVIAGLISIGIAMMYVNAGTDGVLGIVFTLYAAFSGGISGIFLLGLFSARTNRQDTNLLYSGWRRARRLGKLVPVVLLCGFYVKTQAQDNSDGQYREPLKNVLEEVQSRYGVTIKYSDSLVKNKFVNYARWRFRGNVDTTLDNVLKPLDMDVNKTGDKTYKLKNYEYWRRSYEEGVETLDRLASLYHNKEEWEARKAELKPCIYSALQLSPLPASPGTKPIQTPWRKMDGYEVSNIAIEILPGLYINGSLYRPLKIKGRIPVILNPDGHWPRQRYREDCQIRCAALARMGAMAFSYDLFAWGESLLQFKPEDHRRSLAMSIQVLSGIRILDYLLSLKEADKNRVGITGGSGGGTHTVLLTALDDRIKVSVPVASVSAYFYGGCPCESGMPIHACAGGTDNVELAAMAAPRPMLVISDGHDWTDHMPQHDFPYLQKMYGYYGVEGNVGNVHLPADVHDYGITKRTPMYKFMAARLGLNLSAIQAADGKIDESRCTIEPDSALYVFGGHGQNLPSDAIIGFANLEHVFALQHIEAQPYKVSVVDLMLLKRQKLGAFPIAKKVGADGLEVDMGGLGDRETFENSLANDSIRKQFMDTASRLGLEISSLAMTGFYSQSFATRPTWQRMIADCIATMKKMGVHVAFLPLGVASDPVKHPELRDSVIRRLRIAGKMAQEAGVVIGVETLLPASEELKFLKEIGSPGIKSYFNFANALDEKRDLYQELKTLGKDNICMIHCTNTDGVWLQNDPAIDMKKVKATLDAMGWKGWLVIERSRDAKNPKKVEYNFGANTRYVKSIFQ